MGLSNVLHVPCIERSEEITTGEGADVYEKLGPSTVTIMLAPGVAVPNTALVEGAL